MASNAQNIYTPSGRTVILSFNITGQIDFTINHGFTFRPRVWIFTSTFELVEADVIYPQVSQIYINFGGPFVGRVLIG